MNRFIYNIYIYKVYLLLNIGFTLNMSLLIKVVNILASFYYKMYIYSLSTLACGLMIYHVPINVQLVYVCVR